MSFGLTATLLIRLDAYMGQWVSVDSLCEHITIRRQLVLDELEQLVANAQARVLRDEVNGEIYAAMCKPGGGL